MGPLPNGRTLWLIDRGDPNHLHPSWDDPPSGDEGLKKVRRFPTIGRLRTEKVVNGVMFC